MQDIFFLNLKIYLNYQKLKNNLEKIIIIQKEPYEFINIFESQKIIKPSDIDIHIQLPSEIIRFEYKA